MSVMRGAASWLARSTALGGSQHLDVIPQHLGFMWCFLGRHEEGEQEDQWAAKQPEGQGQAAGVHPAAATPGGGCLRTRAARPAARPHLPAAGP